MRGNEREKEKRGGSEEERKREEGKSEGYKA